MAKIPFNIKYRPQIESGEYKVVIGYDWPIEILSWDCIHYNNKGNSYPILAKIRCMNPDGQDFIHWYNEEGKYDPWDGVTLEEQDAVPYCLGHDLYIITPEPELTSWQTFISGCLQKYGLLDCGAADRIAKECSAELLELAKNEIYSHESLVEYAKKAEGKSEALRTRATELTKNLDNSGMDKDSIPYHLIEFMCNLYTCQDWKEIEAVAELYAPRLKAAAMKDLPRWVKFEEASNKLATVWNDFITPWLDWRGHIIAVRDLEKLPGFNE